MRRRVLGALERIPWDALGHSERLDLLRVYQVVLHRMGPLEPRDAYRLARWFRADFPASSREENAELVPLLVYLQAEDTAAKAIALIEQAPTQQEQIDYARSLRLLKTGWTPELYRRFFTWLQKAALYRGGNSFRGFMANIRRDAAANLSDAERLELKPLLERSSTQAQATAAPDRPFVKKWSVDELLALLQTGLKDRDFDRGRALYAAAKCSVCHRYNDEGGGLGPDLSGIAGRFGLRDLVEAIALPSKTISDQYEAVTIATDDGRTITGRIVNLSGEDLIISTDMLVPDRMVHVRRSNIEAMKRSDVSLMPEGLLNTLEAGEVLDLFAYLLSRGERSGAMFRPGGKVGAAAPPRGASGSSSKRRGAPQAHFRPSPSRFLMAPTSPAGRGSKTTGACATAPWSARRRPRERRFTRSFAASAPTAISSCR